MSENEIKTLTLMVECEECKHKFPISSNAAANSLNNKKEFKIDGKSIFLTYYDCPSCGRRHFVQIDDDFSLDKLRDVTNQFAKLTVMKRSGKDVPKKQSSKFKKARQHLSDYRIKLMKDYTGKLIHDNDTDKDFVLRFSV